MSATRCRPSAADRATRPGSARASGSTCARGGTRCRARSDRTREQRVEDRLEFALLIDPVVVDPFGRASSPCQPSVSPRSVAKPASAPGEHAADHVDRVEALIGGELARPAAAPTRPAHHVGRRAVEPVEVLGHGAERDVDRPRNVALGPFVGLADVDHPDRVAERQQFSDRDLAICHGGRLVLRRGPVSRSAGVLMLRSPSAATGTSTTSQHVEQPEDRARPRRRTRPRSPAACRSPHGAQRLHAGSVRADHDVDAVGRSPRLEHVDRAAARGVGGRGTAGRTTAITTAIGRRRRAPEIADDHPAGWPCPGARSATTVSPSRPRLARSPPTNTTGAHPTRRSAFATRAAIGTPSTTNEGLVGAHAGARATGQHGPGRARRRPSVDVGGMPDGSSWRRNRWQRSASSFSPIAAAISPRPRSERRKPRLVGSDQRT